MAMDPILVPDRPAMEGLCFRWIVGGEDAEALSAVHAGRIARDGVDPLSTSEDFPSRDDLRASLSQATAAGLQNQWLAAQIHDRIVGYSRISCWPEMDGMWVYLILGWVLPEWRGRSIGTAMLHGCERMVRHLADVRHPDEKFEFAANASGTEQDTAALLSLEGYSVEYTVLEMGWDVAMSLPAVTLPAGIEVHPASPDHYPLIAAGIGEAYKTEFTNGRFQETHNPVDFAAALRDTKHDPALWQVAWAGRQVAGQVLSLMRNGQAEIFEVSVLPAWRRRKLARALLSRSLHCLSERGAAAVRLHTVAEFRTRAGDLYRSVGFRVWKEFPRYRKSP